MPTKLIFEDIFESSNLLKPLGSKCMIVTGKSSSLNGSLSDVEKALNNQNIPYVIFNEVEENPSLENVESAALLGISENVDFFIGIGGGSPLDATKAISVLVKNPHLNKNNLVDGNSYPTYPVVAIPTTAGTGSEVTPYSIVTLHEKETKTSISTRFFPIYAFLNPKYMESMPLNITLSTALDALSHLVEGYFNTNANYLSDKIAEAGFLSFSECINSLKSSNFTLKDREKLLITSSIAGIVISQTGTSLPHGMGYSITYHKNIPHGFANSVFMGEYLKLCRESMEEKVDKFVKLCSYTSLESLISDINLLTKVDFKVSLEEVESYTSEFLLNDAKLRNHPAPLTKFHIESIFNNSLKNYINK